jgi:hypothetical protein
MIGHGTHDVKRDDTWPTAQSVQAVDPLLGAKVFDGQIRQAAWLGEKYVPGTHGAQVPLAETKWPWREHVTHGAAAIAPEAYFPLGHFSHVVIVAANASGPHATQPAFV